MTDALHHCRRCRWSSAIPAWVAESPHPLLWCQLQQDACKALCPGFEREAGTEGDDD